MAKSRPQEKLKQLPQIGHLLERPGLKTLAARYSHELVKCFCAELIAELRDRLIETGEDIPAEKEILDKIQAKIEDFSPCCATSS